MKWWQSHIIYVINPFMKIIDKVKSGFATVLKYKW